MSDVLQKILADTRIEVARRKTLRPQAEIERAARDAAPARGFAAALQARVDAGGIGLIAEMKRASPSGGQIRPVFDPAALARAYQIGGAACLSVLTDGPYFQGRDEDLVQARAASDLPVLRKDFLVDVWQVAESRALGADCVLLIVAALTDAELGEFADAARAYGLDALVEVHDAQELERAKALDLKLFGINNRNLKTLVTDLATTEALAPSVPAGRLKIAESGVKTHADVVRLRKAGAHCFLVGESLLRHEDVAQATARLVIG
jgi:indole-3-glycerol phosphate synthase